MSVAEALLRMVLAMGVVLGLMWGSARLLQRRSGIGGTPRHRRRTSRSAPELEVVCRQQLSRSAAVAVVRSGERTWLVGITDQQVTLLSETDDEIDLRDPPETTSDSTPVLGRTTRLLARPDGTTGIGSITFCELVDAMRERTVRR
jgi:flagellar biogenesis protein FliO